MKVPSEQEFELVWADGRRERGHGVTPADVAFQLGYGTDDMRDLVDWNEVDAEPVNA